MAKSKYGPSLFEVLKKDRDRGRGVKPNVAIATEADDRPLVEVPPAEPDDPIAEAEAAEVAVKAFEVRGDRICLSLTSVGAAMAVMTVLLLAALAFAIGRGVGWKAGEQAGFVAGFQSVGQQTADDIARARQSLPTPGLLDELGVASREDVPTSTSLPAEPSQPASDASPSPVWVEGLTYVVVQEFMAGARTDAVAAQTFLGQRGVDTAVVQLPQSGKYWLVTTAGFDRTDDTQRRLADDVLSKVRKLGTEYFASGGRYRLEGYFRKLTGSSW